VSRQSEPGPVAPWSCHTLLIKRAWFAFDAHQMQGAAAPLRSPADGGGPCDAPGCHAHRSRWACGSGR